jgi:DNA-binding SARP family transcriptional activator
MDRFWPDHDQSSARNNLNVAVYCLRQTLKSEHSDFIHVLFQDGCYLINPNLMTQVDTEMFEHHVKAAERLMVQHKITDAIEEYRRAETLYQGDFLAEDLYEEWSLDLREHYKFLYVKLLGKLSEFYYQKRALEDCIAVNRKITSVEIGDEHAHRRLMECFARLNQRHLALRQYNTVEEALAKEFDLKPSQETFALYKTIKAQELGEMDCGLCLKQA